MKKLLIIISVFILVSVSCMAFLKNLNPNNRYYEKVKTGGEIEAKYMKMGTYEVEKFEQGALQNYKKYIVYYPAEMKEGSGKYPVIVSNNGTGVKASAYKDWFKHMASYGFIVVGTEEEFSWNGFAAHMSLQYLFKQNDNKDSIFFNRIDKENIGVIGHSQGGVGTFNTVTNGKYPYKAAVALSPTNEALAIALDWDYDVSRINIPIFIMSSTGDGDEKLVINLEGLESIYKNIQDSPLKVKARRNNTDHGTMLVYGDGYVTAWFMWQLKGDMEAAKVFTGNNPEIKNNKFYQDISIDSK